MDALREIKLLPNWVGYKLTKPREVIRNGKPRTKYDKIPVNPNTGLLAESNNTSTWSSYSKAVESVGAFKLDGIGFMFEPPYIGIDLDDCVIDGAINAFGNEVVAKCNSYAEYSPSGTGIHIIAKGDLLKAFKESEIEVYSKGRFFTVTHKPVCLKAITKIDPTFLYSYSKSSTKLLSELPEWAAEALTNIVPQDSVKGRNPVFQRVINSLKSKGKSINEVQTILHPWAVRYEYTEKLDKLIKDQFFRYPQKQAIEMESSYERKPVELFTPASHINEYKQGFTAKEPGSIELPTGLAKLDELTNGLKKGGIWVIGARTGIGKTSLSISISSSLLQKGKRVLFFSTEMGWRDIFNRFISIAAGISLFDIERQTMSDDDRKRHNEYESVFTSQPLFICDNPEPSLADVSDAVKSCNPDVLVFDHIQRVSHNNDQRYLELSRFTKGLNTICRDFSVAGVINSQLNRLAESEIPALHHLKECGALEEEAHAVLLLSKTKGDDSDSSCNMILDLAKNRGPKGIIEAKFDKKSTRFVDLI